jgi:hypothetical protein
MAWQGLTGLKVFYKDTLMLPIESQKSLQQLELGFQRGCSGKLFKLLESTVDKYKITPHRLYNVDETGVSTVIKSHSKILASTGKRQVGTLTAAEPGKLMTTIVCFSSVGEYVPPMFIFPKKKKKNE